MVQSLTVEFMVEKRTPNTVKFQEVLGDRERGVVGSIYVLKRDLERIGNPERLVVTLEAG